MKISTTQRSPRALDDAPEPGEEYQVGGETPENPVDDTADYFELAADPAGGTERPEEMDPEDIIESFYSNGPGLSADQFAQPRVPLVSEIQNDWASQPDRFVDEEFCNRLERNYRDFAAKISESITRLRDMIELYPETARICLEVIEERQRLLSRDIPRELENVERLRESLINIREQELANLRAYGAEYYEWFQAYESGDEYRDGELATFANKPNPLDFEPTLDINGDSRIGESNFYIATKTVDIDGVPTEIHDVIDINTRRPVQFGENGEPLSVASNKDPEFYWTVSNDNLDLVSAEGNEVVLELDSTAMNIVGNGMCGAPISINVPEFIRVDQNGDVLGIHQDGGEIVQGPADASEEEPTWTLERVVQVIIRSVPSTTGEEGYDQIIELMGKESPATPLMSIRVRGTGDTAASKRAIALIAAKEEDERYGRTTGINIEAGGMHAEAEFSAGQESINRIMEEYEINNPEAADVFVSAIGHLTNYDENTGVIVEGFHNVGMIGTTGNDWLFLEEALEEYEDEFPSELGETQILSPNYTSAFRGSQGFNGVFHKTGDFFGSELGLFWGGLGEENQDNVYITTAKDQRVYVNAMNLGETLIANENDSEDGLTWGEDDDCLFAASARLGFQEWWAPEVYERYKDSFNIPEPPLRTDENGDIILPDDDAAYDSLRGFLIASEEVIAGRVGLQIDAQYEALCADILAVTDEDAFNYEDVESLGSGYADDMQNEMDIFFTGWSERTGWRMENDDALFGFEDTLEQ